jgi:hypothetical protein
VIYPMTAGDLVQSVIIMGQRRVADEIPAELLLLKVLDVGYDTDPADELLTVRVEDQQTGEQATLRLHVDTPLLVSGISRS